MQVSSGDLGYIIQTVSSGDALDYSPMLLRLSTDVELLISIIIAIVITVVCYIILKQFTRI